MGPITQLNFLEKDDSKISETADQLRKITHITTYRYDEIPERFHFKNENSGDLLLVADEGWIISWNDKPYSSAGTHGYDPAVQNMQGIFYAIGPDIKSNYTIGSFENINVYPLVCELLGIEPYKDAPDAPDGKLEVLEEILRK